MIAVRPVESDEDVEAWLHVRRVVLPNESAGTVEQFRERTKPVARIAERASRRLGSSP
jgi:hypothetical protein